MFVIRRHFIRGYVVTYRVKGEAVSELWAMLQVDLGLARFAPEVSERFR